MFLRRLATVPVRRLRPIVVFALCLAAAPPAAADWLVTRDGARVETSGEWREEGRLIVFERKDGTLASIRRSEVDLPASERLTREMAERARAPQGEPAEPEAREAKIRLTEKELPPAGRLPRDEADGADDSATAEDAAAEPLRIASWQEVEGAAEAGTAFTGVVRNVSLSMAIGVRVEAKLFDEAGTEIAAGSAELETTALEPGASSRFRASFPDVYHYVRVELRATGTMIESRPEDEAPDDEAPEADGTGSETPPEGPAGFTDPLP